MAQSTGDVPPDMAQSTGDVPPDMSKLTVPEAGEALGISPEAVRNRLSRGTLQSIKENGRVFVLIDRDMARDTGDIPTDMVRNTGDIPTDTPLDHAAVIDAKDETIRILEEQLEAERSASAELRRIVAGLVQRVPELETASEPREAPVSTPEEEDRDGTASPRKGAEQEKRSGWRRFFGLE